MNRWKKKNEMLKFHLFDKTYSIAIYYSLVPVQWIRLNKCDLLRMRWCECQWEKYSLENRNSVDRFSFSFSFCYLNIQKILMCSLNWVLFRFYSTFLFLFVYRARVQILFVSIFIHSDNKLKEMSVHILLD